MIDQKGMGLNPAYWCTMSKNFISTPSRQFHQRFSRAFFVRTLFRQLFLTTYVRKKKAAQRHSYEKSARKTLMKLTAKCTNENF